MSIKPALGWLGLLLFTTTAQAEGARDLLPGKASRSFAHVTRTTVTPKTKAPPPAAAHVAPHRKVREKSAR